MCYFNANKSKMQQATQRTQTENTGLEHTYLNLNL